MDEPKYEKSDQRKEIEETLIRRRRNYVSVFDTASPVVQEVLKDLAKFCRAHKSTIVPNATERDTFVLEGRRQVWLRIAEHLNLTDQQIYEIYTGQKF